MKVVTRKAKLGVRDVADKIGIPLDEWPGNCNAVAKGMLEEGIVQGRLAYGHYRGRIEPGTMFASRAGMGFTHHAWTILRDGMICDPTQWVFLGKKPSIHFGPATEDYDEGGQVLKEQMSALLRPTKAEGKRLSTKGLGYMKDALAVLLDLKLMPVILDEGRIFWLANLPPRHFGNHANARWFYGWLKKKKLLAFVPIDFRYMTGFEKREVGD